MGLLEAGEMIREKRRLRHFLLFLASYPANLQVSRVSSGLLGTFFHWLAMC